MSYIRRGVPAPGYGAAGSFSNKTKTKPRQKLKFYWEERGRELVDTELKQSSLDYGSLLRSAYVNASERFRQKLLKPVTHDLDDDRLTERFGFYRLMRMIVVVTSIELRLYWQIVKIDLFLSQREAFPVELARFSF